jgi:hypothetical protein
MFWSYLEEFLQMEEVFQTVEFLESSDSVSITTFS